MGVMELSSVSIVSNIQCLENDRKNLGVRKDGMVYYYQSKKCEQVLKFSRPCVCGSFHHRTRRHIDCPLNNRYSDVLFRPPK